MRFFKHPLTISAILVAVTAYAAPKVYINLDSTQPQVFMRKTGATTRETVATIDTIGGNPMEFNQGLKVSAGKPLIADTIETNGGGTPPGMVPIGGTVMVFPHLDASNAWQPPSSGAIKDGFMLADGSVVPSGQGSPLQGKTLPDLVGKYAKGGTTITSGATGGSHTHAPTGTVSQPSFSGNATLHTAWFNNQAVSATGSFSGNAVAHTSWFKDSGMSLTGGFTGNAVAHTSWFKDSGMSLTGGFTGNAIAYSTWFNSTALSASFTGSATTYTVSVPSHSHGHSLATSLALSGSAPSLTGTTTFASSEHTHNPGNFIAALAHFSATEVGSRFKTSVGWTSTKHFLVNGEGAGLGGSSSGLEVLGTSETPSATASVGISGGSYSLTGSNTVTGTIGDTGGEDGDANFDASGTNTPQGSVSFAAANDNMADWAKTGSYTPTGTVSVSMDTANDNMQEWAASGSYTPSGSVSVTMNTANDNMQEWAATGSYTPSGSVSVTMAAANDNMQEWAATGSYTPSGTVSQPTFTGDSQNTEPEYVTGVWVIRVL